MKVALNTNRRTQSKANVLTCHVIKVICPYREQSVLGITLCDKDCQWLATGRWFSPGTPVFPTNKTDHHDITEILLKVAFNTIKQTSQLYFRYVLYLTAELLKLYLHMNNAPGLVLPLSTLNSWTGYVSAKFFDKQKLQSFTVLVIFSIDHSVSLSISGWFFIKFSVRCAWEN